MFTGIVQEVGTLAAIEKGASGLSFTIDAPSTTAQLKVGDSVCVSGVCLTCVLFDGDRFRVDLSEETLRRTTLGSLETGARLNLEPALRLSDRLGGHLLQGHVDGVGRLLSVRAEGAGRLYTFEAPPEIMRFTIEKGSIGVDGVSLTAFDVGDTHFTVALIPHTLRATTLGALRPGTLVNLEADLIGKYVQRLFPGALAGNR